MTKPGNMALAATLMTILAGVVTRKSPPEEEEPIDEAEYRARLEQKDAEESARKAERESKLKKRAEAVRRAQTRSGAKEAARRLRQKARLEQKAGVK